MECNEAIILAGGLGTRLRSAVPDLPKCMAPVNGQPFLGFVIEHLQTQGVERFIFALGYMSEAFEGFLSSRLPSSSYQLSIEEEPLGTGGAIKQACLLTEEKTVLVANGDTLFKIDSKKLFSFHHMCGAHCTLSLKPMHNFDRYGVVELNKDYSIKSFQEKKHYDEGLINGGVYALHAEKFRGEDLPDKFSFEKDYLEKFFDKRRMFAVTQDEYFIDIGIPEDYRRAQDELRLKV
jgi:D-glycero-alpha-D-manno-heptose 1-phosphate guanylyltransferase